MTARGRGNAPPLPDERTRPAGDAAAAAAPVGEAAAVRRPSAKAAAALDVTLDDVRRAYPTWRACCPPATDTWRAVLVPSLTVRAATAPGLLHEIEAGIDARRGGRRRAGSRRSVPADPQACLPGHGSGPASQPAGGEHEVRVFPGFHDGSENITLRCCCGEAWNLEPGHTTAELNIFALQHRGGV